VNGAGWAGRALRPAYAGALSEARSPGSLISTTGQAAPAAQRWLTEPSRSPVGWMG